jgi:GNAT superfamily N-acetyltransferase
MTTADLEPAVAGILADDWGDRREWFAFAVDHPGCEVVVAEVDGEVVGTAVATLNGPVAWIGTIWVARAHRRRGLGMDLTRAAMDAADEAGCRTQLLVATSKGRPLYERLGFEVTSWYLTMEAPGRGGAVTTPGTERVRDARPADDLPVLADLDRAATGEDRAHLLRAFVTPATTCVVTAPEDPADVRGFMVRPPWGGGATIAPHPDDAFALLDARRDAYPVDRRIRCGILDMNEAGLARLTADGWTEAWRAPRLQRGAALHWAPTGIWGQFNHALG